jgi:four helix bundle protein
LGIVEEEADETSYWIELLIDTGLINRGRVVDLLQEADEILAMVVSSIRTAKNLQADSKSAIRNQQSAIL